MPKRSIDREIISLLIKQLGNYKGIVTKFNEQNNLISLTLHRIKLSHLPSEIGEFTKLKFLSLQNTQLTQLPPWIGNLINLEQLELDFNKLIQLPPEIGNLIGLQWLGLNQNQLIQLPSEIGNLINLHKLYCGLNELTELPPEVGKLTKLERLALFGNKLTRLPSEIGDLRSLLSLTLRDNQLTHLPIEIGKLINLETLELDNNQLIQIPDEIGNLTSLEKLLVTNNQLTQLPITIANLAKIESLEAANNPNILTPPPEIIARGTSSILSFLHELQKNSIHRYEVKLLVVGEGGTGKSSLLRSLRNEAFNATLSTTHGIEINHLNLPYPHKLQVEMTLNTWDFGGQHIYHSTHQFFLTKRSLYLVVWNARLGAEQGRLSFWLNTIKALAPNAPILLVATHDDERTPDLNYQLYKDTYAQLVGSFSVSNKNRDGLEELKHYIAHQAAEIQLIGQPWPQNWLEAEQHLLTISEHHIYEHTYIDYCQRSHVDAEVAVGTLGNYLHDLGKILYFRDDPLLSNLIVLKPNWVTKAISRVLTDEVTSKANGILSHNELPRIWSIDDEGQAYEQHLFPVFLRLMERFDLSYQIEPVMPGERPTHSLIPQLLPHQPPLGLFAWPKKATQGQALVQMFYRFDFVPAGIMSWFIVRTHRYTMQKHWREGVQLTYQGHFARVELNPMLREIRLAVWGIEPHNFFTILKETLDLILARFDGLHFKREVPCICHWETQSEEQCKELYRYEEDLIHRMRAGRQTIECPVNFVNVSVPELLYGIHISTTHEVLADIDSTQQKLLYQLQVAQQRDVFLLEKMKQLCEWNVRHFVRMWNLEMQKMEAECPNTFVLIRDSTSPFNPKNWIASNYKLLLMCQYPSGPHCVDEKYAYVLHQTREWWAAVSPWLKRLVTFIKFGVPFVGPVGALLDIVNFKNLEAELALLEKITETIPEVVGNDQIDFIQREIDNDRMSEYFSPALRALFGFLKEVDPQQFWGGLHKVITSDGNILWLCEQHAHPYRAPVLQVSS